MKMRKILTVAFLFCISAATPALAQNVWLTTQTAVDNFAETEVTGLLFIGDDGTDPITDLDGLSGLTEVGGRLLVRINMSLTDPRQRNLDSFQPEACQRRH
jgi:hypothetical protein